MKSGIDAAAFAELQRKFVKLRATADLWIGSPGRSASIRALADDAARLASQLDEVTEAFMAKVAKDLGSAGASAKLEAMGEMVKMRLTIIKTKREFAGGHSR